MALSQTKLANSIANPPINREDILVLTASNGAFKGSITGNSSFVRLPNSTAFQEMWAIHLDGRLGHGDSGAWVVSPNSGAFYGHVVAGDPEASVAYIIPAAQILNDIERRLGTKASIPLPSDVEDLSRLLMAAKIDIFIEGDEIDPPCDRCHRLKLKCTKHTTACSACTKKQAQCSWKPDMLDLTSTSNVPTRDNFTTGYPAATNVDASGKIKPELSSSKVYGLLGEVPMLDAPHYEEFLLKLMPPELKMEHVESEQLLDWVHLPERNAYFLGRERELHEVHQALSMDAVCCLTGTTGAGKSQIALEYAHRNAEAYSDVLWVTNPTTMLLDVIGNPSEDVLAMGDKESSDGKTRKKRLVILDNVEGGLEIKFLLYKWDLTEGTILITTRQREFATPAGVLWYRMEIYPPTSNGLTIGGNNLERTRSPHQDSRSEYSGGKDRHSQKIEGLVDQPQKRIKLEHDGTPDVALTQEFSYATSTNPTLLISNLLNSYLEEDSNASEQAEFHIVAHTPHQEEAKSFNKPGSKSQGRKRTKTGCLTCRRRRIKCGEERPTCNNCIKSKRQCDGYTQRLVFKESSDTDRQIPITTFPELSPRAIWPIAPKSPSEFNYSARIPKVASWKEPGKEVVHYAFPPAEPHPAVHMNSRYSDLKGKTDTPNSPHVNEDEDDPFDISDDETLGGTADQEDPIAHLEHQHLENNDLGIIVSLQAGSLFRSTVSLVEKPNALAGYVPSPQSSPLRQSAAAQIFCHFVNYAGPMISLYERHPANPSLIFGGSPVPKSQQHIWSYTMSTIALGNPALLHSILAVSCLHIASIQNSPITASLKHYAYGLRKVAKSISSPTRRGHPATLAACLLLGWYEVMCADFHKWRNHLLGMRLFLREIDFEGVTSYLKSEALQLRNVSNPPLNSQIYLDKQLVAMICGKKLEAGELDGGLKIGSTGTNREKQYTKRDIEAYETQRDLFWWFCKQDAIQSILSGKSLFFDYERWSICPPRSAVGWLNATYGTFDHLVLLLGRVARFASEDVERKRELLRRNGGVWQPPASIPSSLSLNTRVPLGFDTMRKASGQSSLHRAPSSSSHSSNTGMTLSGNQRLDAEREWREIRNAFRVLEDRFGDDFQALGPEYSAPIASPFGPALQYRTFSISGIWMSYYMGLIVTDRVDPSMPPAALAAALPTTKIHGQSIGQIASGIAPDLSALDSVSPWVATALIESSFALFIAGVMYEDNSQRNWTVRRLLDISRVTGFKAAASFAAGLEYAWVKLHGLGQGPPYTRVSKSDNVYDGSPSLGEAGKASYGKDAVGVSIDSSRTPLQFHYALGILGMEEDFRHNDGEDSQ